MAITNFKNLAKTDLRKKALLIAEAGYEAINIEKAIKKRISFNGGFLTITASVGDGDGVKLDLNDFKNIFIIGIGKGSALASYNLAKILGKRLTAGIALDVSPLKAKSYKLKAIIGDHPLPSIGNVKATKEIIQLAKNAKKDDLVITFICGGGSALLCGDNEELKCSQSVFKELTKAGADIIELNTVRKHLSTVKGGGLAKMVYPATMVSLIVSDVLGNDLSMIASGPTVLDKTTKKDALRILKKYNFQFSIFNFQLKETPKDKKYFQNVQNVLFVSNEDALNAMLKKAEKLRLKPKIYSTKIKGEARDVFERLAKNLKKGEAVLAGGETTVKFSKWQMVNSKSLKIKKNSQQVRGKGGRNQEAVLGMLRKWQMVNGKSLKNKQLAINDRRLVAISFASDGHDNTEAGGAIGDILTLEKTKKLKIIPQDYLSRHDSFTFFKKTKDAIYASKKSFNVADLMMVIRE